jgi:hypothetical protein
MSFWGVVKLETYERCFVMKLIPASPYCNLFVENYKKNKNFSKFQFFQALFRKVPCILVKYGKIVLLTYQRPFKLFFLVKKC